VLLATGWLTGGEATGADETLPRIGPAPEFTLTNQDGQRASLSALRGRVVALTFIYTTCVDTCPLLTAKMASLQERLGRDFGPRVQFLSVTVDPARDTPAVLKRYAEQHGARPRRARPGPSVRRPVTRFALRHNTCPPVRSTLTAVME